jgi:hypothetical protein
VAPALVAPVAESTAAAAQVSASNRVRRCDMEGVPFTMVTGQRRPRLGVTPEWARLAGGEPIGSLQR